MRRVSLAGSQRAADRWNAQHDVGTDVSYESIKGDLATRRETKTRGKAFVTDCGIAAIFVEGVSGYVALDHVKPLAKTRGSMSRSHDQEPKAEEAEL